MEKSILKDTLLKLRKEMLKQIKKGNGEVEVEVEMVKSEEEPKNYTVVPKEEKYMSKDGRTFKETEEDVWRPLDELNNEEEDALTKDYKMKRERAAELEKGLYKAGNLKPSKPMNMEKPKRRGR